MEKVAKFLSLINLHIRGALDSKINHLYPTTIYRAKKDLPSLSQHCFGAYFQLRGAVVHFQEIIPEFWILIPLP